MYQPLATNPPAQTAQSLYPSQGTAARGPYVPQTPIQNPNNTSGQGLANLGNFGPQNPLTGGTSQQALIAQSNAAAIANPILQQRQTPTQTPAQIAAAQAAQQQQQQQINANMAAYFAGQPLPFPGVSTQQTFASQASTPQAQAAATGTQPSIGDTTVQRMMQPGVPVGGTTVAAPTATDASQDLTPGTGTLTGSVGVGTATANTSQATYSSTNCS